MKKFLIFALKYFRFAFRITPHLRDRWVFRYRKLSIHEERLYSSERTQLAFSATAQMRETLSNSARDRRKIVKIVKTRKGKMILFRDIQT